MLEAIDSPDNVIAIRLVGKIEKADYDTVLAPAVEKQLAQFDELRIVAVMDDAFESYSIAAGWEDTKVGIGHLSKWKRCAIVTNHDWIRHGIAMFRWMIPGEIKVFDVGETAAAIEWTAASG